MLTNKKMTVVGESRVNDDITLARFGAVIDMGTLDVTFTSSIIDRENAKTYRDTRRKDWQEFEDSVYAIQDLLRSSNNDSEQAEDESVT